MKRASADVFGGEAPGRGEARRRRVAGAPFGYAAALALNAALRAEAPGALRLRASHRFVRGDGGQVLEAYTKAYAANDAHAHLLCAMLAEHVPGGAAQVAIDRHTLEAPPSLYAWCAQNAQNAANLELVEVQCFHPSGAQTRFFVPVAIATP